LAAELLQEIAQENPELTKVFPGSTDAVPEDDSFAEHASGLYVPGDSLGMIVFLLLGAVAVGMILEVVAGRLDGLWDLWFKSRFEMGRVQRARWRW
jgi:hypothetical protein